MTSPGAPVVYQPQRIVRYVLPFAFLLFAGVAVWLVVQTAQGRGGPQPWFVVWIAIGLWNAYWWLFRVCTEVCVEGDRLSWRTPLRRGEAPLADATRIRPSRGMQRQMAVVELRDRRPLVVPVRYGFERLSQALQAGAPGLQVDA